jgi:hypothetical protein
VSPEGHKEPAGIALVDAELAGDLGGARLTQAGEHLEGGQGSVNRLDTYARVVLSATLEAWAR